jgi:hypothetical protein
MYLYLSVLCLFLPPHKQAPQMKEFTSASCDLETNKRRELWFWIRSHGSVRSRGDLHLLPHLLRAAVRALVVLYVIRFRRGDPHALAVEPPLADVAADPELARVVKAAAASTKGLRVLLLVFLVIVFVILLGGRSCCPGTLGMAIFSSLRENRKKDAIPSE